MNLFRKIIAFFKNLFKENKEIKMLEQPVDLEKIYADFRNSVKVEKNIIKKERKVETLTSTGDGLGIQDKLSY